eukprot:365192-Chlamydomonas_euryale.AAC.29
MANMSMLDKLSQVDTCVRWSTAVCIRWLTAICVQWSTAFCDTQIQDDEFATLRAHPEQIIATDCIFTETKDGQVKAEVGQNLCQHSLAQDRIATNAQHEACRPQHESHAKHADGHIDLDDKQPVVQSLKDKAALVHTRPPRTRIFEVDAAQQQLCECVWQQSVTVQVSSHHHV